MQFSNLIFCQCLILIFYHLHRNCDLAPLFFLCHWGTFFLLYFIWFFKILKNDKNEQILTKKIDVWAIFSGKILTWQENEPTGKKVGIKSRRTTKIDKRWKVEILRTRNPLSRLQNYDWWFFIFIFLKSKLNKMLFNFR